MKYDNVFLPLTSSKCKEAPPQPGGARRLGDLLQPSTIRRRQASDAVAVVGGAPLAAPWAAGPGCGLSLTIQVVGVVIHFDWSGRSQAFKAKRK